MGQSKEQFTQQRDRQFNSLSRRKKQIELNRKNSYDLRFTGRDKPQKS